MTIYTSTLTNSAIDYKVDGVSKLKLSFAAAPSRLTLQGGSGGFSLLGGLAVPQLDNDAATKKFVEDKITEVELGLSWKEAAKVKTMNDADQLDVTATAGLTLTGRANGAFPVTDGITLAASDRILVTRTILNADIKLTGLTNQLYTVGQVLTQATSLAVGTVFATVTGTDVTVNVTSAAQFSNTVGHTITATDGTSGATPPSAAAGTPTEVVDTHSVGPYNGIYSITTLGDGSTKYVLTRTSDANTLAAGSGDIRSAAIYISEGTDGRGTGWVQTSNVTTLGTHDVVFSQFATVSEVGTSDGLTMDGKNIMINVDSGTMEISGDKVRVKNLGINTDQIAAGAVTNTHIQAIADGYAGINGNKIQNATIATEQLGPNSVKNAKIATGQVTGALAPNAGTYSEGDMPGKIYPGTIGNLDISTLAVIDGSKLANNSIVGSKLKKANIAAGDFADDIGFTGGQIAVNAITKDHMLPSSVSGSGKGTNWAEGDTVSIIPASISKDDFLAKGSTTQANATYLGTDAATFIENKTITGALMVGKTVDSDQIKDGAINAVKIKAESIISGNIGTGQISNGNLAGASVDGDKIQKPCITSLHLTAGSVKAGAIEDNAVTSAKIGNNAIESRHLGVIENLSLGGTLTASSVILTSAAGGSGSAVTKMNLAKTKTVVIPFAMGDPDAITASPRAKTLGTLYDGTTPENGWELPTSYAFNHGDGSTSNHRSRIGGGELATAGGGGGTPAAGRGVIDFAWDDHVTGVLVAWGATVKTLGNAPTTICSKIEVTLWGTGADASISDDAADDNSTVYGQGGEHKVFTDVASSDISGVYTPISVIGTHIDGARRIKTIAVLISVLEGGGTAIIPDNTTFNLTTLILSDNSVALESDTPYNDQ
tara:strand:+ start:16873 stop:19530 length:2658 start_codon:yes stop_codon:yes gene_type:complete